MPPNPQGRRRGRQKGRESPLSEERLHPVSACLPAFAQGWLTGSLGPLSPERKPPPVCASASAAWPTSGLELARFKLFTPLGFSSKSPRANPSPFLQRKGDEHSTASGHCAGFRRWCFREHPRKDQEAGAIASLCAQVEEQLRDSRLILEQQPDIVLVSEPTSGTDK